MAQPADKKRPPKSLAIDTISPIAKQPGTVEKAHFSLSEAAAYYSVTPLTVRRWIAQGHLPASRVGASAIRIKRADLENLARPIPTVRRSA